MSRLLFNCTSVSLTLALPMMVFLKHNAYPLASHEVVVIFLAIAIIGAALGAVGSLVGPMRRLPCRGIAMMLGVMFLVTLILPSGQPVVSEGELDGLNQDLPFVLHIVLDAQIGIGGIPLELERAPYVKREMRGFYQENEFQLYGGAYSRFYNTTYSMRNLLNYGLKSATSEFSDGSVLLRGNDWFDRLHEQGYRISVIQPDYLRYVEHPDAGDRAVTYRLGGAIQPLSRTAVSTKDKALLIVGSCLKASRYLRPLLVDRVIPLTHLGSMEMMAEVAGQVANANRGQAIFAHILLPHGPYAFSEYCALDADIGNWLPSKSRDAAPWRNTSESRATRYRAYLKQVLCVQERLNDIFQVLRDRGMWEDSIIIIHGDHGSRINMVPALPGTADLMTDQDYFDAFSALFAVKRPGIPGGYFDAQLPIDHLFQRMFLEGVALDDAELENNPFVFIMGEGSMLGSTMPKRRR